MPKWLIAVSEQQRKAIQSNNYDQIAKWYVNYIFANFNHESDNQTTEYLN